MDQLVPPPPQPVQRTNRKRSAQGVYSCDISLEDLMMHSHLPSHKAAQALGLGITAFKRLCRKRGVPRWPYARLKGGSKTPFELEGEPFKADAGSEPRSGSSQPSGTSEDTLSSSHTVPAAVPAADLAGPVGSAEATAAGGVSSLLKLAEAAEEGSRWPEVLPAPTRPMASTVPRQQDAPLDPFKLQAMLSPFGRNPISPFGALGAPLGSIPAPGSPDRASHQALPSPRQDGSPFAFPAGMTSGPALGPATLQYTWSAPPLAAVAHEQGGFGSGSGSGLLTAQGSWPAYARLAPRQGSGTLCPHPCSAFQPYSSLSAGAKPAARQHSEPLPRPAPNGAVLCPPPMADYASPMASYTPRWAGPTGLPARPHRVHPTFANPGHYSRPAEVTEALPMQGSQAQDRRRKDMLVLAAILENQRHMQCMQRLRSMLEHAQRQ